MAKYIKQELSDMLKTGKQRVYYRLKIERNVDFQEFIERVCSHHSGISQGEAMKVLMTAADTLAGLMAEGYSVSLDGWGVFKATLGLERDKEMDTLEDDTPKRNARSLCINGVNFQADKALVRNTRIRCKLERGGVSRLCRSPYTPKERLQKALDYLKKHKAMKVKHYMTLTNLSHTVAAKELRDFSQDSSSGITTIGRGSGLTYIPSTVL